MEGDWFVCDFTVSIGMVRYLCFPGNTPRLSTSSSVSSSVPIDKSKATHKRSFPNQTDYITNLNKRKLTDVLQRVLSTFVKMCTRIDDTFTLHQRLLV